MKRLFNMLMIGLLALYLFACSDDAADGAGSTGSGGGVIIVDPVDTTPPSFRIGPLSVPDSDRALITVSLSEAGTMYWLCQAASAAAPGSAAIRAGGHPVTVPNTNAFSFFAT